MKLEAVLDALLPGIRGQAYRRAMNSHQADDFTQEAIIAVITAYRAKKRKLKNDTLIRYLGTTAKNKIIDCQRQSASCYSKEADLYDWTGTVEQPNEIEVADLLEKILQRVSPEARSILLEKLQPSDKTEKLIEDVRKQRRKAAERGYLTSHNVKLTNNIIAEALGLSKRKVKTSIEEIRIVTIKLLTID